MRRTDPNKKVKSIVIVMCTDNRDKMPRPVMITPWLLMGAQLERGSSNLLVTMLRC